LLTWTLVRNRSCCCGIDHSLHEAVSRQHPAALEFLLTHGTKEALNRPCGGQRPLDRAIRMTHVEGDVGHKMARLLLEHGAEPNAAGDSPLHDAAASSCAPAARLLLDHRADPNAENGCGLTPLHVACRRLLFSCGDMQEEVVQVLLAHGANPCIRDQRGLLASDYARATGAIPTMNIHAPSSNLVACLERAERWAARRTALLARTRGDREHVLCRLPLDVFQAVVRCL